MIYNFKSIGKDNTRQQMIMSIHIILGYVSGNDITTNSETFENSGSKHLQNSLKHIHRMSAQCLTVSV